MKKASARRKRIGRGSSVLIGLDFLGEILESAIYSAYVDRSIPMSMALVGPSGSGKSKLLFAYRQNRGLHTTDDLTSQGLFELLEDDHKFELWHLLVGDFNKVLAHKKHVSEGTMASLLSALADGTVRIDDGRRQKVVEHPPIGLLTAMTKEMYESHAEKFSDLGLTRRVLPLFFTYKPDTQVQISREIRRDKVSLGQIVPRSLKLPTKKVNVQIPEAAAAHLELLAGYLAEAQSWKPQRRRNLQTWTITYKPFKGEQPLPFTPQLVLRTLARAHALREGRKVVTKPDLDFITKLLEYCRYDAPQQV